MVMRILLLDLKENQKKQSHLKHQEQMSQNFPRSTSAGYRPHANEAHACRPSNYRLVQPWARSATPLAAPAIYADAVF
jgi:hypothetical protein